MLIAIVVVVILIGYGAMKYVASDFVNPSGRLVELNETVDVQPFLERCDSLAKVSKLYPDSAYIQSLGVEYLPDHRVVYLDCDTTSIATIDFVAGYPMIFRLDDLKTGESLSGRSEISPAAKALIKQKLIRFVNAVENAEPCP